MFSNFKKSRFFMLLWMIFLSGFALSEDSFNIYAQTAAIEARVTSVSGGATLSGNGLNGARLVRGAVLAPGHEIDTRGGGRVVIDLSDGSQVVVLPGTRLVFGDYRNAGSLRELLQITLGRIRVKINRFKNNPNPYRIKSPTASIAVRGTEFQVSVEPSGETLVVVSEGLVEVSSLNNPADALLAEPGRSVIVRRDFTLDFFISGATGSGGAKSGKQKTSGTGDSSDAPIKRDSESAKVFERFTETAAQSGELPKVSRFTAFADAHLDSLDNPAYAAAFKEIEGRVYFVPSVSDIDACGEDTQNCNGLSETDPFDYGGALEAAIFLPLPYRLVVGVSGSVLTNGVQTAGDADNSFFTGLPSEPGVFSKFGTTNNKFFNGSLLVARKFGSHDQTSVGLSFERLLSNGNFSSTFTPKDQSETISLKRESGSSRVERKQVTFGIKHEFRSLSLGAYYRYGASAIFDNSSNVNPFQNFNNTPEIRMIYGKSQAHSSEIGFRARGAISNRLFYGTEGALLFRNSRKNLIQFNIPDQTINSSENSATNRLSLGLGLGYLWRPRTIFSFDVSGGLIRNKSTRYEDLTGNLLETRAGGNRFLSAQAVVQTDVWRKLFASASILSLSQSASIDSRLFADRLGRRLTSAGIVMPDGITKSFNQNFYSNYSIGWRFKQNFIFQYTLTTDYGQSNPRHSFLFRYDFDFSRD